MKIRDYGIIAMVVLIWGINFLFMKWALLEVPPPVLGMLRFACVLFPAILLLKKPYVAWKWLILYGLTLSFGQFGLVFLALSWQFPTGLTALVLQGQVFLTVLFASLLFAEPVKFHHVMGMITAGVGLALIGIGQYQGNLSFISLLPVLGASVSWACGNLIVKKIGQVDALSLVVWGSLSTFVAFTLVSVMLYGVDGVVNVVANLSVKGWFSVAFLAYISSLMGYTGWGFLLARYPAGNVTPFILGVPPVALLVGFLWLGEKLIIWHWLGIITVMLGLLVHMLGGRLFKK